MKIAHILQPAVALMAWTMVMWLWMYVTRIPAMQRAKIDDANLKGGTGKDLDAVKARGVRRGDAEAAVQVFLARFKAQHQHAAAQLQAHFV